MTKPNLSAAYESSVPIRQQRRRESLAATFKPNALYDRLLAIRDRDPADYIARTTHSLRLSIAHYYEAKSAHEETNT
jgi:hypothetical protein